MTHAPLAPYGPNTPAIRRFLVRFAALGAAQRDAVLAAYQVRAETPEWFHAEAVLAHTMEASGRRDITDTLAGPLLQLVRSEDDLSSDTEQPLPPIAEPALAALLALAVSDLLPPDVEDTLYAPFATTISARDLR